MMEENCKVHSHYAERIPTELRTHTHTHYGMSRISSGPQYFIIFNSLSGPIITPGHENKSAVLSYGWCTLDMTAEFRQLDIEPCY